MTADDRNVNSENSINYTATFTPKTLTSAAQEVMTNAGNGRWYLIPQNVTAWSRNKTISVESDDIMKNTDNGTYLALKVKITANGGALKIYPATGDDSGWMAVPVPSTLAFAQGVRYNVTVDFFGSNGAGYVDPEEPSDLDGNAGTNDNGKKIMGGAIKFDATVNPWGNIDVTISL